MDLWCIGRLPTWQASLTENKFTSSTLIVSIVQEPERSVTGCHVAGGICCFSVKSKFLGHIVDNLRVGGAGVTSLSTSVDDRERGEKGNVPHKVC